MPLLSYFFFLLPSSFSTISKNNSKSAVKSVSKSKGKILLALRT
jgi:hypothetical protein